MYVEEVNSKEIKMKYFYLTAIITFSLLYMTSCIPMNKLGSQVIVEPIEALKLCDGEVRSYSALTGKIVCKK